MVDNPNDHAPHDLFFKTSLQVTRVAQDFFKKFLSEYQRHKVDISSLKYEEGSFVDDIIGRGEIDMLFSAKIDNKPGYLLLLLEHQTKSDRYMPLRIFLYIAMILKNYWKKNPKFEYLPEVISSIYYTGEGKYTAPKSMRDLFVNEEAAARIIGEYPVLELNSTSDDEIRGYNCASLMMFINKYLKNKDIAKYLEAIFDVMHEIGNENFIYLKSCLRYTLKNGDNENPEKIVKLFVNSVSPEKGEEIMNMEQRLIDKGVAQGVAQGIDEGIMKERYRMAKAMLAAGHDPEFIRKFTNLTIEQINALRGQDVL